MRLSYSTLLFLATGMTACAHAAKPYSFTLDRSAGEVDTILHTLSANGMKPASVNRDAGTIATEWYDTHYRFGEFNYQGDLEEHTEVFLRHRVAVHHTDGRSVVILDTDARRCSAVDLPVTRVEMESRCEPLALLFPTHQKLADELGSKLRLALGGTVATGSAM